MADSLSPRDTSQAMQNPGERMLFLASGMGTGSASSFIEEQERNGQREMVGATTIPVCNLSGTDNDLTALGFALGDTCPDDRLFRAATLPDGWKREASDHAMWSYIVDELGRRRVSLFYKAAFYDRDAHLSVSTVRGYVGECLYDDTIPVLDEAWATRGTVLAALHDIRAKHEEDAAFWREHGKPGYVADYEQKAAACDALKARIVDGES